jgi:hypothetical protein
MLMSGVIQGDYEHHVDTYIMQPTGPGDPVSRLGFGLSSFVRGSVSAALQPHLNSAPPPQRSLHGRQLCHLRRWLYNGVFCLRHGLHAEQRRVQPE